MTEVLEELEWDNIAHNGWQLLESMLSCFTQWPSSGEEYTTLSAVVSTITELKLHVH